jgi:hypothetical protein
MRALPQIALTVSIPPIVWRAETGFVHDEARTAADVLRFEQRVRGHSLDISTALIDELRNYPAAALLWVTFTRADALRYGPAAALIELRWNIPAFVLATDDAGGFLLFSPDDFTTSTGGAAMADPMNPAADKGLFAFVMAKVTDVVTHALGIPSTPPPIDAAPASRAGEIEDEEARKRAARSSGDMGNPAYTQLAANIRPEVASTPDGTQTITTAKSSQHDAHPEEQAVAQKASDYIRDLLARAQDSATKETDAPGVTPEPRPLTLDDIADDPWNAVVMPLPKDATPELLGAALSSAEYCVEGEYDLMQQAQAGEYVPSGWTPGEDSPDVHEYNEARWLAALDRAELITARQNDESTTRQEAELDARNAGISTPEPAAAGSSYLKDLLSRADDAKRESEGAEVTPLEHREGQTPTGGGRGIF